MRRYSSSFFTFTKNVWKDVHIAISWANQIWTQLNVCQPSEVISSSKFLLSFFDNFPLECFVSSKSSPRTLLSRDQTVFPDKYWEKTLKTGPWGKFRILWHPLLWHLVLSILQIQRVGVSFPCTENQGNNYCKFSWDLSKKYWRHDDWKLYVRNGSFKRRWKRN